MVKAQELRQMSDDQLTHELRQLEQELFRLRVQAATERLDAPSNLRKLRRDIARIKTVQGEKQRETVVDELPQPDQQEAEASEVVTEVSHGG